MKITAQEEYGLRCLLQLARFPHGQVVSVKEIAAKEALSTAYAEKLLRILSRTGLVHSVRGIKGGYVLNRPASTVTLGEVVRALGTMETTNHICHSFTGQQDACVHFSNCGIRSVWSVVIHRMEQMLDQIHLSDLAHQDEAAMGDTLQRQVSLRLPRS